jgi:PhnB protein
VKLNTYLNYGGNCEQAFRFYEQHLGGKVTAMLRRGDLPDGDRSPGAGANSVQYASLELGGAEVFGSDVPPERFQPMRSAYLALAVDSDAEAERVYALLSDGGEIFMPLGETFFASRFAMLRDRFGTSWMVMRTRPR